MKRQLAITATAALALGLLLGGPAYSNEKMTDPKAAPNPSTYSVQDFTFSGLSLFDGMRYVTGSNK